MPDKGQHDTGAASAAPAVISQEQTILWLDHAGRVIGRTWCHSRVMPKRGEHRIELARRHRRVAVRMACAWLSENQAIPRRLDGSAEYTIRGDELHLVSGFRVTEGHA